MYKPLPDSLTIKDSGIHGLGLFTKEAIQFGTVLGLIHFSFQGETIRTPLGAFGNHSDVPTCEKFQESFDADSYPGHYYKGYKGYLGEGGYIRTLQSLPEGEEITWKYTLYEIT